ncbi:CHASE2 domain-containing protein [Candidatus Pelagibacter communis]|uniref:CHASE2 domain-containing protein n=1 Tax=Pelagibacter ubique TaxID=198252 RepID=UPI00094CEAF3|nr:CHASE2 domain-containing protein [Candidatus Pelagibacter ubique]
MKNLKKYLGLIFLALLVLIKIQDSNFVKRIENISYDIYQSIFEQNSEFNDVLIVDIDEKSIGEIGQFPWRRDVFANLVEKLENLEASVISFDIFFSEEDKQNPSKILGELNISNKGVLDTDQSLITAIQNSNVILPVLGDISVFDKMNNSKPKTNFISRGGDAENYLYNFKNKITSLEVINNAAKGIGNISYLDNQDGVLRSLPILLKIDGDIWPSLSLETLRLLHKNKSILIQSSESGIKTIRTKNYSFNTDPNAIVHINYKKFSKDKYISAVDILNDKISKNIIKDKIILIGSSAQGLFDFVKIPSGKVIPGVETHAHAIENIINNDFIIKNLKTDIIEIIILLISLILVLIIPKKVNPKLSIVFFVGLCVFLITSSLVFYQFNYFIDIFYTTLGSAFLFLVTLYFRYLQENEIAIENEKKQIVLKKEREIAGEVQKKLFPKEFEQKNILYAKNVPARDVSGDYYDYIKISEDEFYFTLADVSGKGVKAGILMANAAAVFRSMAKLNKEVSTIARYINNQVADSSYQGMFITAVVGKYNIKEKKIEYINLGHEPIMVYDENFNFEYYKSTLPPLGIMAMDNDDFFQTNEISLANKNLVIYTDGVTEGYLENNQELEAKGVEKEIIDNKFKSPVSIIEHLSGILTKRKEPLRDDITCLIISGF